MKHINNQAKVEEPSVFRFFLTLKDIAFERFSYQLFFLFHFFVV